MSGLDGSKYDGYGSESGAAQLYMASYARNCKAIGVLWGIFSICFAIIDIVAFVQPQWIGDSSSSRGTGHFGLWKYCVLLQDGQELVCQGSLDDFSSIPSAAFRAATVFVGLSVIFILLCLCCFLLFFFFKASTVFHICAWIQVLSAVCLVVGILSFPAGWDAPEVREVCGVLTRDFHAGDCSLRWSFILAVIGSFDIVVLAALAFVLGARYVRLSSHGGFSTSSYKGELNSAYVPDNRSTTSRKSMNLQPVMLMPPSSATGVAGASVGDRFSDYSHHHQRGGRGTGGKSSGSHYRSEYITSPMQNFQL